MFVNYTNDSASYRTQATVAINRPPAIFGGPFEPGQYFVWLHSGVEEPPVDPTLKIVVNGEGRPWFAKDAEPEDRIPDNCAHCPCFEDAVQACIPCGITAEIELDLEYSGWGNPVGGCSECEDMNAVWALDQQHIQTNQPCEWIAPHSKCPPPVQGGHKAFQFASTTLKFIAVGGGWKLHLHLFPTPTQLGAFNIVWEVPVTFRLEKNCHTISNTGGGGTEGEVHFTTHLFGFPTGLQVTANELDPDRCITGADAANITASVTGW